MTSSFNFNDSVLSLKHDFPALEKVVFVDLLDPASRAQVENIADMRDTMRIYTDKKSSACVKTPGKATTILLYTGDDAGWFLGPDVPLEQQLDFILAHEAAHAFIPVKEHNSIHSESIADTFGLLRHFRKYGDDSQLPENLFFLRTAIFVMMARFDDIKHFTAPVIAQAISIHAKTSFTNIDVGEIESTVKKIARAAPKESSIIGILKECRTLRDLTEGPTGFSLGDIFNEVSARADDVLDLAKLVYGGMTKGVFISPTGKAVPLHQDFRAMIEAKQAGIVAENAFINMAFNDTRPSIRQ